MAKPRITAHIGDTAVWCDSTGWHAADREDERIIARALAIFRPTGYIPDFRIAELAHLIGIFGDLLTVDHIAPAPEYDPNVIY